MVIISFDALKLKAFRDARNEALRLGRTTFMFDGEMYSTAYAKYLILYLESKLMP